MLAMRQRSLTPIALSYDARGFTVPRLTARQVLHVVALRGYIAIILTARGYTVHTHCCHNVVAAVLPHVLHVVARCMNDIMSSMRTPG